MGKFTTNTETAEETREATGFEGKLPRCCYCGDLLTSNEFDFEPGSTPGFYSAHTECTHTHPEGDFVVYSFCNGEARNTRRYTTAERAMSEMEHLAGTNRPLWGFRVEQVSTRQSFGHCLGRLR